MKLKSLLATLLLLTGMSVAQTTIQPIVSTTPTQRITVISPPGKSRDVLVFYNTHNLGRTVCVLFYVDSNPALTYNVDASEVDNTQMTFTTDMVGDVFIGTVFSVVREQAFHANIGSSYTDGPCKETK